MFWRRRDGAQRVSGDRAARHAAGSRSRRHVPAHPLTPWQQIRHNTGEGVLEAVRAAVLRRPSLIDPGTTPSRLGFITAIVIGHGRSGSCRLSSARMRTGPGAAAPAASKQAAQNI
ncbi:hypothetical protein GN956_G10311 [Arapaima gigas]